MCLVVVAWQVHPDWPLVLVSNRDERRDRPAHPMGWWPERDILAGRDRVAGGTWLAVDRAGRAAVVTSVRSPAERVGGPTRGQLPLAALSTGSPASTPADMAGFHLLFADRDALWLQSNRRDPPGPPMRLGPGVHAVSNALPGQDWEKTRRAAAAVRAALDGPVSVDDLLALFAAREPVPDDLLPDTGVGRDLERALSARFVDLPGYGTRCTTVVLRRPGEVQVVERTHDPAGETRAQRWDAC
jgi:uncharacterized protein with NRDE domain